MRVLQETQIDMKSVGISLITDMPSGNRLSDNTANEAIRLHDHSISQKETITDIKYLQQRTHRITDEKDARVLNLLMQGYNMREVAEITQQSRQSVHYRLDAIAKDICYP